MGEMTREKAIKLIKQTPQFIPDACAWCGARTLKEAATRCTPQSTESGEYYCGIPEDAPDTGGKVYQLNPAWAALEVYLYGWYAVDEGYTKTPPTWEGSAD